MLAVTSTTSFVVEVWDVGEDLQRYSVEAPIGLYNDRQEIEAGYKQVKRFVAKTTSTEFVLRFFYFAFACLLYSLVRLIDHLVQVRFTDDPCVTMHDVLTSLK